MTLPVTRMGHALGTIVFAIAIPLVSQLAAPSSASAQVVFINPPTGAPAQASSATTIMLDPLYAVAAAVEPEEMYSIPLQSPLGGEVFSHPERFWSFSIVEIAPGGTLTGDCIRGAELVGGDRRTDVGDRGNNRQ